MSHSHLSAIQLLGLTEFKTTDLSMSPILPSSKRVTSDLKL